MLICSLENKLDLLMLLELFGCNKEVLLCKLVNAKSDVVDLVERLHPGIMSPILVFEKMLTIIKCKEAGGLEKFFVARRRLCSCSFATPLAVLLSVSKSRLLLLMSTCSKE